MHEIAAGYFKVEAMPPRVGPAGERGEADDWWETIEDEHAGQDLGAFLAMTGGQIRD